MFYFCLKILRYWFVSHPFVQANAIGRSAKTVREFLEKNYTDEAIATDNESIKLAIKALLEVRSNALIYFGKFQTDP